MRIEAGGGRGPEDKPSHNLENIGEHLKSLREKASFSGGINAEDQGLPTEQVGSQPLGDAPGSYVVFPPRPGAPPSAPGTSGESQSKDAPNAWENNPEIFRTRLVGGLKGLRRAIDRAAALKEYNDQHPPSEILDEDSRMVVQMAANWQSGRQGGLEEAFDLIVAYITGKREWEEPEHGGE